MICEIHFLLQLIPEMQRKWFVHWLMFIINNQYGINWFSNTLQLEPCNIMFKVISDIMAHWYDTRNTIVISINFCNGKEMICALMFIIPNHYGIKLLTNLLQSQPYNVMFKVNSDIMAHWYEWYEKKKTIVTVIYFLWK